MKMPRLKLTPPSRTEGFMVGAAALGAAAFPPLGLWPLSLVSTFLFVYLLRDRDASEARNLGVEYGLVYAAGTMYWFFGIFGVLSICLFALMAGYFGLLANLIAVTRGQRPWLRSLLIATFAVGVEWLRGDAWYLRFPWYTMPHALAQEPTSIAAARWVGTYGLSFIIWAFIGWGALGRVWYSAPLVLLPMSSWLLAPLDEPNRKALLLQTEQPAGVERLIPNIEPKPVDLAVLPEYAYYDSYKHALRSKQGPSEMARKLRCPVVFGAVDGDYYSLTFHNVAVVIDADGKVLGMFPKQRPVPLFADGKPGTERPVFPVEQGILGVAVCYDLDAPNIAASLVHQGATVLVVPTYDAMSWSRIQHVHHELLLRLRAVETDRWIVRAASSGRSEAVSPHGVPSAEGVEIGKDGSVTVGYRHRDSVSLGSYLFWIGPASAIGTLAFALAKGFSYCRHSRQNVPSSTDSGGTEYTESRPTSSTETT
jgi:apolipoprotein N-acyltransferase